MRQTLFAILLGTSILASVLTAARAQESATVTYLVTFDHSNGSQPQGGLLLSSDGNFYGTTKDGGASNDGTVYRITPTGVLTTLYSFSGSDGAAPMGGLIEGRDGNLYGTTGYGGANGGFGTVFRISPAGVFTSLHSFANTDGATPEGALVQGKDGNFYGTTYGGINRFGTIYRLTATGAFDTLHVFGGSDGAYPEAGLTQGEDGNFYGTTSGGGTNGNIYRITPQGTLTGLYYFSSPTTSQTNSDGLGPSCKLVQGSDGTFYGTTRGGGAHGYGTVFRVTSTGTLTTLHAFSGGDGLSPETGLVLGHDGNFYGTTYGNPTFGYSNGQVSAGYDGTVFRMSTGGIFSTVYYFNNESGGIQPSAGLAVSSDGSFYGTTAFSATNSYGTIFKLILGTTASHPVFFAGEAVLANGVYYLQFASGNPFGYYSYLTDPHYIYHFDLGYEYMFDAADGNSGVYLYDFKSSTFFYTSPTFPFPYLYDFSLNTVLYYYPDPSNAGHYNTDGVRYFYRFDTGQIITK